MILSFMMRVEIISYSLLNITQKINEFTVTKGIENIPNDPPTETEPERPEPEQPDESQEPEM